MESGVDFIAVDFPQANRLTIHILAAVAEHEAVMISARTKAALAAAKARGVKLGCENDAIAAYAIKGHRASIAARRAKASKRADDLLPVIQSIQAAGANSLRQVAGVLNECGIRTARGDEWSAVQVQRMLEA